MFDPNTWEFLRKTGILAGLASAVVAVAWFFWTTTNRITVLENQIQAIVVTTATGTISRTGTSQNETQPSTQINVLAQTCADLAKKVSEQSYVSVFDATVSAMNNLGCSRLKN